MAQRITWKVSRSYPLTVKKPEFALLYLPFRLKGQSGTTSSAKYISGFGEPLHGTD